MLRRGTRDAADVVAVVISPEVEATLKTVLRRSESECEDGGGTEKRARSWGSVSRIREVMSGVERRALVKILGGGKLVGLLIWVGDWRLELDGKRGGYGSVAIDSEQRDICSKWRERRDIVVGVDIRELLVECLLYASMVRGSRDFVACRNHCTVGNRRISLITPFYPSPIYGCSAYIDVRTICPLFPKRKLSHE